MMELTSPEHEVTCPNCNGIRICTCNTPRRHAIDAEQPYLKSTWCRSCRLKFHDESRDPDDDTDQRAYDGFNRFSPR